MVQFAVLIPTRNRPEKVIKLLNSILTSTLLPSQIVIVASGDNIFSQLDNFQSRLPITYLHTECSGQINQKKIGITLLKRDIEWCLFLDDDLLIDEATVETAFKEGKRIGLAGLSGIGFSLPVTSRMPSSSKFVRLIGSIFGIASTPLGKVLVSGHAVSYMQSNKTIETEWLNGASMWRTQLLKLYGKGLPSTKYAACEDLVFSYPLRKLGKLIYVPEAKIYFQDEEKTDFDNVEVLKYASYWRYYFVNQHNELSKFEFAKSEIGRTLFAALNTKPKDLVQYFRLFYHIMKVLLFILFRRNPIRVLESM